MPLLTKHEWSDVSVKLHSYRGPLWFSLSSRRTCDVASRKSCILNINRNQGIVPRRFRNVHLAEWEMDLLHRQELFTSLRSAVALKIGYSFFKNAKLVKVITRNLPYFHHLQKLDLSDCIFDDEETLLVTKALLYFPKLKSLFLQNGSVCYRMKNLQKCFRFLDLHECGFRISQHRSPIASQIVLSFGNLHKLYLYQYAFFTLADSVASEIAHALPKLPFLKVLVMETNLFQDHLVDFFGTPTSYLRSLEAFRYKKYRRHYLSETEIMMIGRWLRGSSALHTLQFSAKHTNSLAKFVKELATYPHLKFLNINGKQRETLTDEQLFNATQSLFGNFTLAL